MNYLEAREKLAAVLAPITDDDPDVLVDLVDSIQPPALMINWGRLDPASTSCVRQGQLVITCVAGRLEPGSGAAKLEDLISYTFGRLRADPGAWPDDGVSEHRQFVIGNVNYLAARITLRVTLTGGP